MGKTTIKNGFSATARVCIQLLGHEINIFTEEFGRPTLSVHRGQQDVLRTLSGFESVPNGVPLHCTGETLLWVMKAIEEVAYKKG